MRGVLAGHDPRGIELPDRGIVVLALLDVLEHVGAKHPCRHRRRDDPHERAAEEGRAHDRRPRESLRIHTEGRRKVGGYGGRGGPPWARNTRRNARLFSRSAIRASDAAFPRPQAAVRQNLRERLLVDGVAEVVGIDRFGEEADFAYWKTANYFQILH